MEADTASARKAKPRAKANVASNQQAKTDSQGKPVKTGRPSSYTAEIGRKVCELLASGMPMTPARMKEHGLPDPTTIYRWTEDNEAFRQEYTRARQYQAHVYADEIIDLADTATDAGLARIQVDTRKWYASKIIPKLYGDTQRIDVSADIGVTAARVLMDLTQQARDAKAVIDVTPTLIGENTVKDNKEIE